MQESKPKHIQSFIVLTSLFFMWGLITVLVDFLIPRLKDIFNYGNFEAGLVQFAFFIAYFFISIPAGFLLKRIGYKRGILLGLLVMGMGCAMFYPAAAMRSFPVFLIAYFTLAGGMTILQVAANPYVTVLGSKEGASARLNLAQAFNALGTAIAPILGATFLLSDKILKSDEIAALSDTAKATYFSAEANAVQAPFLVLAGIIVLLAVTILFIPLPKVLVETKKGYGEVLKNKKLMFGAVGILLYVGAEVAIGSYGTIYFVNLGLADIIRKSEFMTMLFNMINTGDIMTIDEKGVAGAFLFFYWSGAMIGRFIGSLLTTLFPPNKVLIFFGSIAILLIGVSIFGDGLVAMWALLAVGLFNSIMFPTIFAMSVEDLGDLKPQGSGILCMAIVGGGIIPPLYGLGADHFGYKISMLLLILCYAYIAIFGSLFSKKVKV